MNYWAIAAITIFNFLAGYYVGYTSGHTEAMRKVRLRREL